MRDLDLIHLKHLVRMINDPGAALTRSDGIALLILLRDSSPAKSMLRDLGHSVAHDARDRGVSFDYMEKFALNVRRVFIHGGRLVIKLMFPIRDIVLEMNTLFRRIGIEELIDPDDTRVHYLLASMIADVLHGTTYRLRVATGTLTRGWQPDGTRAFTAQFKFHDDIAGVITMPAHLTLSLIHI